MDEIVYGDDDFSIVWEPMALVWDEVDALKDAVWSDLNTSEYREEPWLHQTCSRDAVTGGRHVTLRRGSRPLLCGLHSAKPPTDLSSLANRAPRPTSCASRRGILSVGAPGSAEYGATLDVLRRVDADVWVFNEIAGEVAISTASPRTTGTVYGADVRPWSGYQRNAVISRLALLDADDLDPVELSGDPEASDMSRPSCASRWRRRRASRWWCSAVTGSRASTTGTTGRVVTSWRARQALAILTPRPRSWSWET